MSTDALKFRNASQQILRDKQPFVRVHDIVVEAYIPTDETVVSFLLREGQENRLETMMQLVEQAPERMLLGSLLEREEKVNLLLTTKPKRMLKSAVARALNTIVEHAPDRFLWVRFLMLGVVPLEKKRADMKRYRDAVRLFRVGMPPVEVSDLMEHEIPMRTRVEAFQTPYREALEFVTFLKTEFECFAKRAQFLMRHKSMELAQVSLRWEEWGRLFRVGCEFWRGKLDLFFTMLTMAF